MRAYDAQRRRRPSSSTQETDVPDLVDALSAPGARLTRVEPQAPDARGAVLRHPPGAPVSRSHRPRRQPSPVVGIAAHRPAAAAAGARDFWLPLTIVALLFFVIIPTFLLLILGRQGRQPRQQAERRRRQPAEGPPGQRARPEGPRAGVVRARGVPVRAAGDHRAADGVVRSGRAHHRRRARARQRRVPRPLPRHRTPDLPRQAHRQPHPRLLHRRDRASRSTRSS